MYAVDPKDLDKIDEAFTPHPLDEDQHERVNELRRKTRAVAETLLECCPKGRERATAMTKLEEFAMWSNKAIALEKELPKPPGSEGAIHLTGDGG